MSANLKIALDQVFSHLRELKRPIATRRRSGANPRDVRAGLQAYGLQPPPDLIELYSLCDGTETATGEAVDQIQFFPGFYWMSVEEALAVYRSLIESDKWNKVWLPIFANGGGDFYAVVCDDRLADFGGVVGFVLGEAEYLVEFVSVTAMLQTIARSFSDNAFIVTNGFLESYYPKMRVIAASTQPDFVAHGG